MKRSLKTRLLIRKNRWKSQYGKDLRDYISAASLMAAVFAVTAALIFLFNFTISSPYFAIKGTVIRGCRELTEKDLLALAAIKPSQTIFAINIRSMVRRISSNPWVKDVTVRREFPNRLILEIKERAPLALCRVDQDFYLLDGDGFLFKKLTDDDDVDVPILTGCYREGRMDAELLHKTIDLLKYLAASKIFPAVHMVSEVNASEAGGLSLFTDNGLCLKLGFDNYESKFKRLLPVLTALNKKNVDERFLNIDLRDTRKIYVEKRGGLKPRGKAGAKDRVHT